MIKNLFCKHVWKEINNYTNVVGCNISVVYCSLCNSKKEISNKLWKEINEIQIINRKHTLK
jgi:hypothetical protein